MNNETVETLKLGKLRSNEVYQLTKLSEIAPRYPHGCKQCVYLGRSEDGNHDLYFHTQAGHETVLARFDVEPSDYKSGLSFIYFDPELSTAYKLAVMRNLIS